MKKIKKIMLVLVLMIGVLANGIIGNVKAIDNKVYLDIANGAIEISDTGYKQAELLDSSIIEVPHIGEYEIIGTSTEKAYVTVVGGTHNITINNLNIGEVNDTLFCPMSIRNGSTVNLTLKGVNTLTGGPSQKVQGTAGLEVSSGNAIVIDGDGTLNVTGGTASAGIGGSALQTGGDIRIIGGNINSFGGISTAGLYGGTGIGGGVKGSTGNIYIGGNAVVKATGYYGSAGIGSPGLLKNPDILTQKIVITDNAKVTATAGKKVVGAGESSSAAGIGGGYNSKGGYIEISGNAQVDAISTDNGASIGGGSTAKYLAETSILIKDNANVKALVIITDFMDPTPSIGNGRYSTTQGTLTLEGKPTVLAHTYGADDYPVYLMEDKAISASIVNNSSSVMLKGYYKMMDNLAENGSDSYVNIITNENQSYEIVYKDIALENKATRFYADFAMISPTNSFEIKDSKGDYITKTTAGLKDNYTVNYKKGNDIVKEVQVSQNKPTSKPTIAGDTGKVVEGWYTEDTFNNKWDFTNDVTSDIDLYMKQNDVYTVDFQPNNGDTIESQSIVSGNKVVEPNIEKNGYTLEGWYTEDTYTNKWDFTINNVNSNITLYAKWEPLQYTISIKEDSQKILRVYKNGINEIGDINSKKLTLEMTNKGSLINVDYDELEWSIENIAGFESYAAVCSVDQTTGTVIGLKSGIAKVTVKLKNGYDASNANTYDSVIIIVPGNVRKSGSLTMVDATIVSKKVSLNTKLEDQVTCDNKEYLEELADMDNSGTITMADVMKISRMVSSLDRPSN